MSVNIGIIGAGIHSQLAHIANFDEINDCSVVALAELRPTLGRLVARKYSIPRLYNSHYELLNDSDVDAVVVVTRRHATGPIVLDSLNAGKHVLSEKPMAHTVKQAEKLVAAAKRSNTIYSIGYMKRCDSGIRTSKLILNNLLAIKKLGKIVYVRSYCYCGDIGIGNKKSIMTDEIRPDGLRLWPIAPGWLAKEKHEDYAWFLNVNIHIINLLRYLLDVTPHVLSADLKHVNGRMASFDFGAYNGCFEMAENKVCAWQEGIEIIFEHGKLSVKLPPPLQDDMAAEILLVSSDGEKKIDSKASFMWSFRQQAELFISDVANRSSSLSDGDDSVEDLKIVEDIWRKAEY